MSGMSKEAAQKILDNVISDEIAVALKGEPRKQYLDALDEVYGPQEQRAKDMGFGERQWYHGTNVPIDEFKNEAKGISTRAQSAKKGFFFAEDPSTAADYADLSHEHGIIREGDNVTTKWMSETAPIEEKVGYRDIDKVRNNYFDLKNKSSKDFLKKEKAVFEKQVNNWEKIRQSGDQWAFRVKEYGSMDKYIDAMQGKIKERYQNFLDNYKKPSRADIAQAKQNYYDIVSKFHETNNPYFADKMMSNYLNTKDPEELKILKTAIKSGKDRSASGGQNVLAVRLRGNKDTIHVKDYEGQGYRDTTYNDEMQKALDDKKEAVLFRNTEDPGNPHNRVQQDIAAVFDPSQIRSKFAAFDPRFKNSKKILAGTAGGLLGGRMLANELGDE